MPSYRFYLLRVAISILKQRLQMLTEKHRFYAGAGFIIAATLLVYLPALNGGFIWDDDISLYRNPIIHSPHGLHLIWFSTKPYDYFPLTYSSFWFEWRLWETVPLGYRLVNVLLHGLGAVFFWRVLQTLRIPGAWWAGLIFALHPVCIASVAWITERKNTLSLLFCLVAALYYFRFVHSRERRLLVVSLVSFALALLSKTSVVVLPPILVAWHWWERQRDLEHRIPWRQAARWLTPYFALAFGLGLVTIWFQTHRAIGQGISEVDPIHQRLLAGGVSTWLYLEKLLWPANLSMVYPRLELDSRTWWAWLTAPAWLALFFFGCRFRRSWGKHLCFVVFSFLVSLFPVVGLFPMFYFKYSQMADHWQYLAMLPVIAGVTGFLHWAAARIPVPQCGSMFTAIAAIALGILTWNRAAVYQNSTSLWTDVIQKNPECWVAYINLGTQAPDAVTAEACFKKALELNPNSSLALNNLGVTAASLGRLDEAMDYFRRAIEINPQDTEAHGNLGVILLRSNQVDAALPHLIENLRLQPNSPMAYCNTGDAKRKLGRCDEALQLYRAALQLQPRMPEAMYGIGCVLLSDSRPAEAVPYFREAIAGRPGFPDALAAMNAALAASTGAVNQPQAP